MNFNLSYSGTFGNVTATLGVDGQSIGTASGLKNGAAAQRWAKKTAKEYKAARTQEANDSHDVQVIVNYTGTKAFSL